MTLVVYDSFDGRLIGSMSGSYIKPVGELKYLEAEVPEGRYVVSVNVLTTPHQVILNEAPVDPIAVKLKELEDKLAEHDLRLTETENLSWIALEGSADTYEAVLPFLPQ